MDMRGKKGRASRGFILVTVLFTLLLAGFFIQSLMATGQASVKAARNWRQQDGCLLAAQSVLEKAAWDIHGKFSAYYNESPSWGKLSWFSTYGASSVGGSGAATMPSGVAFNGYTVTVTVLNSVRYGTTRGRVTLRSSATDGGNANRSITAVLEFGLASSRVFDYAYFVNNFGWFYGSTITANGEVRANGNFSFQSSPKVNGDVYASINADNGAKGTVNGSVTSSSLSNYYSAGDTRARPGNPTSSGGTPWTMGYDGASTSYQKLDPLTMPYFGDLSDYEAMASTQGGTIKQGKTTLVNGTYAGTGPSGVAANPDNNSIVLVGTSSNPIVVNGPVVIPGDVIISGVVSGQGTIIAGRNIHVVNNVTYASPPSWSKPDTSPDKTAGTNAKKDLVCFAAKGNIILGDYTSKDWTSACSSYMQPSFTSSYATDPTDSAIGYDSDNNAANGAVFDGNYTSTEVTGGKKVAAKGNVARKYYECSSEKAFLALSPSNNITQLDGVYYTNHLFGGKTGSFALNGSLVARDEAIIFSGSTKFNWDIRLGSESADAVGIDIFLPQSLGNPGIKYWREN